MYETLNSHSVIKSKIAFQLKCYKAAELNLITGMLQGLSILPKYQSLNPSHTEISPKKI